MFFRWTFTFVFAVGLGALALLPWWAIYVMLTDGREILWSVLPFLVVICLLELAALIDWLFGLK